MLDLLLDNEPTVRLSVFLGVFALIAIWEAASPRRERGYSRWLRWTSNLGIVAVNTVVIRLLFPIAAVGMAVATADSGWGLLNIIDLPVWLEILIAVVLLDMVIYLQHVMVHAVPVLWRLHRMHHADLDYDVTTGARFHPIEIILSMAIKLATVSVLGASPAAVIIFEVLLNATAMFNHGNLRLPLAIDQAIRVLIVTPDMHRVHHSVIPAETNSNFGFNLSIWDRLFGTYCAQPSMGHDDMTLGIEDFRTAADMRLDKMLMQPFVGTAGSYAINREKKDVPGSD
ncbi:MAG: sterol desaturase family protein [Rhodospirillaceae bacterium]|jgi:sterol desaturase/sphingolipid hydroxylase (fatty acid hydroxylase superfamily)|nr:sterol desaturase family protein [Rhodospirillaceae bacterium]MBT5308914.1 sterol desaturase family protein [Rhodospirillaceae bacterium]MBT7354937.1 sterol desaturase family protein [Rhodospirillaceae bacterium]